jgi:hypothetical protein
VPVSDDLDERDAKRDAAAFPAVVREFARRRFDSASQRLADQKVLPELPDDAADLDVLGQASALSRVS